jgi:hypothetical protein
MTPDVRSVRTEGEASVVGSGFKGFGGTSADGMTDVSLGDVLSLSPRSQTAV